MRRAEDVPREALQREFDVTYYDSMDDALADSNDVPDGTIVGEFPDGIKRMVPIVTGGPNDASLTGEVRTTSSTGGQKGTKRARFDLIPTGPLKELAEHYGRGALKYDDNQWRKGYEWSKSYAAKQRHDNAFWAGYDYDVCSNDPEGCSFVTAEGEEYVPVEPDTCYNHTGSHHMAASAWHAFCLLEFKDRYPEHDDRYISPEQREKNAHPLLRMEAK